MSGNIPRTRNQDRGECSRKSNRRPDIPSGDPSPSKKQRPYERNRPGPILSIPWYIEDSDLIFCNMLLAPIECGYGVRVLTPAEADPTNPVLRISNDYEHFVFLNNHNLLENPNFEDSIPYRVYDEYIRQYDMRLSRADVSLSEWDTIVRDCGLMAGDRVCFARFLDTRVSDDFVYILRIERNPPLDDGNNDDEESDLTTSLTANQVFRILYRRLPMVKNRDQGPGSRDFPQEGHCISKTMTLASIATHGKLYLSSTEAIILSDNPRIVKIPTGGNYEKVIRVFDEENREYTMTVSARYIRRRRRFFYSVGGDQWMAFVTSHNLEQGDELMIYKCLDSTFPTRYYHAFRCVSKNEDLVTATATAGETQSADDATDQKRNVPEGSGSRSDVCLLRE